MGETAEIGETAEKKDWLSKLDDKAEAKGGFIKTLWQLVKFLVVSGGVTILQLLLAALLPLIFDKVTAELPAFLQAIFNPDAIFDVSTEAGAADYALYAPNGIVTWGYVLPFFLSNAIANVFGYIENKKRTFKSDAPTYCFVIYIVLLVCLILFSTWLQGAIYGWLSSMDVAFLTNSIVRIIASLVCGFVQMVVLFPMEKFVLLKEKKKEE
ncbi:MAG: hypothetical protein LIO43_06025 [Clostridiales bacterium]|nr:hypothetical protein [Clostridiales bacterium]